MAYIKKGEELGEEEKKIIAYNLKVIKLLWRVRHKNLGDKSPSKNKYNGKSLYGTLEKSQETLRGMERMQVNLPVEKTKKWAETIHEKTGIPAEYFVGKEIIKIPIKKDILMEYAEYVELYNDVDDKLEEVKENEHKGTRIVLEQGKKMKQLSIEEKNAALRKLNNKDAQDALEAIEFVRIRTEKIKENNKKIRDAVKPFWEEDFLRGLEESEPKVYALLYYISKGRNCNKGDFDSIHGITKCLNSKNGEELEKISEDDLYEYIVALRKQLRVAEATYILKEDSNKIINKKLFKILFN